MTSGALQDAHLPFHDSQLFGFETEADTNVSLCRLALWLLEPLPSHLAGLNEVSPCLWRC